MERLIDGAVLAALAGLGLLATLRARWLSARGARLFPVDRERSVLEALADLGFALAFLLWVYESLAFAVPLDHHLVPGAARATLLHAAAPKLAGVALLALGLLVYGLGIRHLGVSWRLGIDRERAGPLVTDGIYARSRNPVYLGLLLLAAGVFLCLDRLVLLFLLLAFALYFRHLIGREERFLATRYEDEWRAYARRVGRWWTWRARRPQGAAPPDPERGGRA